ncbi:hypothetical protein BLOT_007550 [Blomia tropicalis]|nr:hypothetical protein BLOT_007550 [Blomia tropicalis]
MIELIKILLLNPPYQIEKNTNKTKLVNEIQKLMTYTSVGHILQGYKFFDISIYDQELSLLVSVNVLSPYLHQHNLILIKLYVVLNFYALVEKI